MLRMVPRLLVVWGVFARSWAREPTCELWCAGNECTELNGDVASECGGCGGGGCHPGAKDFPVAPASGDEDELYPGCLSQSCERACMAHLRAVATGKARPFLPTPWGADGASTCDIQRIDRSSLEGMDRQELGRLFSQPAIVTGLTSKWTAHSLWANPETFAR